MRRHELMWVQFFWYTFWRIQAQIEEIRRRCFGITEANSERGV